MEASEAKRMIVERRGSLVYSGSAVPLPGWSAVIRFATCLLILCVAGPAGAEERPEDNPEVIRLEQTLKDAANRDSVRFQLALAYRNTGTVEGRIRALDLFDHLRGPYFNDPFYHIEIARTYLEGGRVSEARDQLGRAYRLDPTNVSVYILSARLLPPEPAPLRRTRRGEGGALRARPRSCPRRTESGCPLPQVPLSLSRAQPEPDRPGRSKIVADEPARRRFYVGIPRMSAACFSARLDHWTWESPSKPTSTSAAAWPAPAPSSRSHITTRPTARPPVLTRLASRAP